VIIKFEDLPRFTVRSIINKATKSPELIFENAPKSGRPKVLNAKAERVLFRHTDKCLTDTLAALGTPSKSGRQLGRNTVRKTFKAYGKQKRKRRKKPFLKPKNKRIRRIHGRYCKVLTPADWGFIIWSDKAYFEVGEDGRVLFVMRAAGQKYEDRMLAPTFKSGRTRLGVAACFMSDKMGPIITLPASMRINQ